jgi:hypothetical protein
MDYVRFRHWPAACKHQSMVKKIISGMILAAGLAVSASAADVYVRIGPRVQSWNAAQLRRLAAMSGSRAITTGTAVVRMGRGRWEQPPRARARWQNDITG